MIEIDTKMLIVAYKFEREEGATNKQRISAVEVRYADSGFDVAAFLNRPAYPNRAILDESGEFINAMAFPAGADNERTPLKVVGR